MRFVSADAKPLPLSEQIQAALSSAQRSAPPTPSAPSPAATADATADTAVDAATSVAADEHASSHVHHGGGSSSGLSVQRVLVSDDATRSTAVLLQDKGGLPYPVFVNPYTGTVLGSLTSSQWLPGLTRALHGGWPLGTAGSWLLELGDGWAIVMILTGLYLWWPRGRGMRALWPRFHAGTRVLLRDLHSCVAVWFSVVFLFFLISALPWTAFWGGKLLHAIESGIGQTSPAGFSPGGASLDHFTQALQPVDRAVSTARASGVQGTLDVRLAPWPDAPLFITNTRVLPSQDRTLLANASSGEIHGDYSNADLPALPRFVALGVHVHQADFGAANVWLNTAFAASLIWLTITGVLSWWHRRPSGKLAAPPRIRTAPPRGVLVAGTLVCVLLPLLGLSVLLLLLIDRALGSRLQGVAQ